MCRDRSLVPLGTPCLCAGASMGAPPLAFAAPPAAAPEPLALLAAQKERPANWGKSHAAWLEAQSPRRDPHGSSQK